jgi:hypothetical protein
MNPEHTPQPSWPALLASLTLGWLGAGSASAAGFSEPPLMVHGKILKLGQGGGYQMFSGTLHVRLVSRQDPTHVVDLDIPIRKAGASGEYSYRTEIDQHTDPPSDQLSTTLRVGGGLHSYALQSATVDGHPASLLDPGQSGDITTGFSERGTEIRLDFRTDLPMPDTDGDALPDWWEELHGLDPLNAGDALKDADSDGWSNRREFEISTNPLVANNAPLLQDSRLVVTCGGSAGIFLPIVDADTPADKLRLTLLNGGAGLAWRRSGIPLTDGSVFSYADIIAGRISAEISLSFLKDTVRLRVEDLVSAGVEAQELGVTVEGFNPGHRQLANPAMWLDAATLEAGAPIMEWADASIEHRDGYQPYTEFRPAAGTDGRLRFNGGQFLYVDDRGERLEQFTAFMAFDAGMETPGDQTVLSSSDLNLGVGGSQSGIHGRSLRLIQPGRTIFGPVVNPGEPLQMTVASEVDGTMLRTGGGAAFFSRTSAAAPDSSFTTIGARQALSSVTAEDFFHGSLREVLVFGGSILPETGRLIEAYQLSRWQRMRVWNYRSATRPVVLSAADGVRNAISGGESNDDLTGGDLADLLHGGRGSNRLTGRAGADRFRFTKTGGQDVITDFSAASGDVIDLSEIFAGKTGLPSNFVKFSTFVTRGSDNIPRVDTRLDLIYEGVGTAAAQTITLQGVGLGSSDLARLLGEGNLQLGGPRFDSSMTLAVSAADPFVPGRTRKLNVLRSGNVNAAVEVPLSFSGTARMDLDYQVTGATGTGSVRRVTFARGSATASVDIVPMTARAAEDMTVAVTVLPVPQVNDGGAQIEFGIPAASTFTIQTTSHIHTPLGRNGAVKVSRRGGTDQPIDLSLAFAGTLIGGVNYQPIAPVLHFAPGEDSRSFAVVPMGNAPAGDELPAATIGISPSPLRYATAEPAETSVFWLTRGTMDTLMSYADWQQAYFPGAPGTETDLLDGDHDGKSSLFEYLMGSDPLRPDGLPFDFMMLAGPAGHELRWKSARVLTDMRIQLEESGDFTNWSRTTRIDRETQRWTTDGRIQHSVQLKPSPTPGNRYFRLRPIPIPGN